MISHRNTVAHTEQMLALRDVGNRRIRANGGRVWPETFICFLPFYHGCQSCILIAFFLWR